MKLIIIMSIVLTACCRPADAGEIQVSAKHLSDTTGNQYFVMQRWLGVEIKYQPTEESLYYFVSHDTAGVQTTYPAFEMSFTGVGFGTNTKVTEHVKFYGQLGYYFVDTSLKGRFKCAKYSCGEGLFYGLNDQWADLHDKGLVDFDEYEIKTKNGYGITLGLESSHKLSKNMDLVFGIEWQARYVQVMVAGMSKASFGDYDVNGQRWESHFRGINSTNFKVGLDYRF